MWVNLVSHKVFVVQNCKVKKLVTALSQIHVGRALQSLDVLGAPVQTVAKVNLLTCASLWRRGWRAWWYLVVAINWSM
jgi:hypothetical protein